jgi:uncharacterized membrane protein YedE/YeeE
MVPFHPLPALVGGLLIGVATTGLLLFNGRVAGVSGILEGLSSRQPGEAAWRACFVVGLVVGGIALRVVDDAAFPDDPSASLPLLAVAGLLVGVGTRLAGGCTSGHGVCGISRLSPRSIAITLTFMAAGALAVYLVRAGVGT